MGSVGRIVTNESANNSVTSENTIENTNQSNREEEQAARDAFYRWYDREVTQARRAAREGNGERLSFLQGTSSGNNTQDRSSVVDEYERVTGKKLPDRLKRQLSSYTTRVR